MPDPSTSLSLENLLSLLVVEWQLTRTSPMGRPSSGVNQNGSEVSLTLTPLTMHQRGCPQNFDEFYKAAKTLPGMETTRDAFLWYCRTRLHYSCSTVCVTFIEFVVPELLKRGIKTLHVRTPLSGISRVDIKRIRMKGLNFSPLGDKVHLLVMSNFMGPCKNPVECGSHNMLQCTETSLVFDPTLGQLSGNMQPALFSNLGEYRTKFVGTIINVYDSQREEIEGQKQRDISLANLLGKPDNHPLRIAERVVDAFISDNEGRSTYCANCLGQASPRSKLLRCGKCKNVFYCSKTCQILAWKLHKGDCKCYF
ncbi:hypothetical protein HJC23_009630 [Cyclotella cryptica]|uniref:MYND-type domain-containing protein n=1 Tax=Cyclotella cryptica TaxID=29204 RepID=A0ABD3PXX6_9STRA